MDCCARRLQYPLLPLLIAGFGTFGFYAWIAQLMTILLNDVRYLMQALQSEPFTREGSSILEPSLAETRRDDVPNQVEMQQPVDMLAEHNS